MGQEATAATGGDEQASMYQKHPPYDFAVYFPKASGWKPILIGGLLVLGSFLVVPALILVGYGYRVARAAAFGEETPPQLTEWKGLLVDGARFTVLFIPLAFLSVIPLLGTYVALAFLTAFVGSDSLSGALTDGRAISFLTSAYFLKGFVLYIVLLVGLWIAMVLLVVVGWVFGPAYIIIASGAFWGYVYKHAADDGIVPPPE